MAANVPYQCRVCEWYGIIIDPHAPEGGCGCRSTTGKFLAMADLGLHVCLRWAIATEYLQPNWFLCVVYG
jgi:hypothetical protein